MREPDRRILIEDVAVGSEEIKNVTNRVSITCAGKGIDALAGSPNRAEILKLLIERFKTGGSYGSRSDGKRDNET